MNINELIAQEGNEKAFTYREHECLVLRGPIGCLCGYVCIDKTSLPLNYSDEIYNGINVHGGLTFGAFIKGKKYLGFDCAHYGDLMPKVHYSDDGVYRDMAYVENEVKKLVNQLIELEKLCK